MSKIFILLYVYYVTINLQFPYEYGMNFIYYFITDVVMKNVNKILRMKLKVHFELINAVNYKK